MYRTDSASPRSNAPVHGRILAALATLAVAVGLVGAVAAPAQAAGTGVISGAVTGAGSTPLQNVLVQLFQCGAPNPSSADGCWTITGTQTYTAANGTYTFTGLEPGTYGLGFSPQSNNAQYAYEYYNNKTVFGQQDGFTVANGATTTINASLQLGASIAGTVLGDDGLPGDDIIVSATNTATPNSSSTAFVQPDGSYAFQGLQPGEYYVYAGPDHDSPSNLVREYYDNKPDAASATRFTVASGATYTANFVLATGGTVSGNVKNGSNANLAGIDVELYEEDANGYWSRAAQTTTDASGNYLIEGVELGEYVLRFSDFGGTYAQEYLGGSADRAGAARIDLGPGTSLSGQNVVLAAGGTLAGTLTQKPTAGSAVPSANAFVDVYLIDSEGVAEPLSSSLQTNPSGQFSLSGLAPGQYLVRSYGSGSGGGDGGWAAEYAGGYYEDEATRFTISGTGTTAGANVEVVPGVAIQGQITDTGLAPVPGVWASILHERTPGNWVTPPPYGGSGDDVSYNVAYLPPGNYIVYFEDHSGSANPYVTQYYNNKPTQGTATVITAPNGGRFTGVTARMTRDPWPALAATATASPASPNGSNGWYRSGTVTVTFGATGGTDVPNTFQYKINGAASWTTGSSTTVSTNGTTTITYRAVEDGLQTSPEGTLVIKRDTAVPTVSSSLSGRSVTVTAADTGSSGVASIQYRIAPSTTWVAYTAPVNVGNAAATIEFRATDTAGNVSATGSRTVDAAVGSVTVTTTASPSSPNGANGWYTSNPTVTGSGTASLGGTVTIESKVGAGSYTEVASRTVSTDGTTVLTFRGEDQYGNLSSEVTRTIKLDKVAPTVSSSISGRTVTLTSADATSGVASTQYRIAPSTTWVSYSSPVNVGNAAATIEFRATDTAGNVSAVGSRSVGAATASVSVTLDPASPNGSNSWYTSSVTLTATGSTTGTGPVALQSKLNAGAYTALTGPLVVTAQGTTTVTVKASVSGGIESTEALRTVKIDSVKPTVSSSRVDRVVTITSSDATSGVASTQYRIAPSTTWVTYTGPVTVPGSSGATVEFRATDTAGNVSATGSTTLPDGPLPEAERIQGGDRFAVSTAISGQSFPTAGSADVVFVSTGLVFADALSAGPAAALENGPLLLVPPTGVPASVVDEIERLDPERIVVIGGELSVPPAVYSQLSALVGGANISRITGADRFEVSRTVARQVFGEADVAYVATGLNFPDALAGGGAAGVDGAPVILVNGGATSLDAATRDLLEDLGVTTIKVLGGPNSVSPGVFADLGDIADTIRLWGADRFEAARAINEHAFPDGADLVLISTGLNFPDALAGSAWAAKVQAPLYTVQTTCIPASVLASIEEMNPSEIVLLGGPASLTTAVQNLTPCS